MKFSIPAKTSPYKSLRALLCGAAIWTGYAQAATSDALFQGFQAPPHETRPVV